MDDFTFSAPDFGSNPIQYIKDSKAELKKVKWPTKKQIIDGTILVIIISVVVGTLLGVSDYLFAQLFAVILR